MSMFTDVTASVAHGSRIGQQSGLMIQRVFTKPGSDPLNKIAWSSRRSEIKSPDSKRVIFAMEDVEAPEDWSQTAVDIAADKYFRKAGVPGRGHEHSIRQIVDRVAKAIRKSGEEQGGYFATPEDAQAFEDELRYMLATQRGAFNSPVWFNVGIYEAYGAKGSACGLWAYDLERKATFETDSTYVRPQSSACFIQSIDDDLMDIADFVKREMRLFKGGSGSGANFSNLRAAGESLSSGGTSSGVMSYLDVFDKSAGAIKSGGTTRRAAKMVILNADHPDIEKFVEWKAREEDKVRALVKSGFSLDDAYQTVSGQNANNSVRVTDEFMQAVVKGDSWNTTWRTTGQVAKTLDARKLFRKIAEMSWKCADPGLQFDTTINRWHTTPKSGRIEGSNPCQPAWATLLTPDGIRTMGEISVGDTIWSGKRWTKVTRKIETGVKLVEEFHTRAGTFYGTENHRVVQDGVKIEVGQADSIDIAAADEREISASPLDPQDVIDGLVFGDGAVFSAMESLSPLLLIGANDKDYFESEIKSFLIEPRENFIKYAWQVKTTLERNEVPRTYERKIPDRFRKGSDVKVRGFLRGLFSANGSIVGGNRITLKATSFDVIASAQEMLSSLGIRSYYTTNKAHDVTFDNGTYTCKESYDLNVTADRWRFCDLIGFVQGYKQEKLEAACTNTMQQGETRPSSWRGRVMGCKASKNSYEIVSRTPLGMEPVYDITVDADEHTYWTGGLLVSNCSEYMHLNDSACNLASLNLMKFARRDQSGDHVRYVFDDVSFRHAARVFLIAQEILVDYAAYPTQKIAQNAHDYRQLGLGYANLGAMLMVMGIPYDSPEALAVTGAVTAMLTGTGYLTSAEIASSKGPFSGFAHNREEMLEVMRMHAAKSYELEKASSQPGLTEVARRIWDETVEAGARYGYRNAQATVLAPTGTIGLMMDCDTTGIEPDFSLVKAKKLAGGGFLKIVNRSVDPALEAMGYTPEQRAEAVKHVLENGTIEGWKDLRPEHLPVFDCANKCGSGQRFIAPMGHVRMLAAAQPFVSGSISKTVNCPNETTVDEIEALHMKAWELGLKCIAIYRDGSKQVQVLSSSDNKEPAKEQPKTEALTESSTPKEASKPVVLGPPPTRRHRLQHKRAGGFTQELVVGGQKLYIRTGEYADGSLGEIFVDMHKDGATMRSLMNVFSIAVSLGLQHGVPLEEFVKAFAFQRFEPAGKVECHDHLKMAGSVIDAVFRVLAFEYMGDAGLEYVQVKPTDDELAEMRGRRALLLEMNGLKAKASEAAKSGHGLKAKTGEAAKSGYDHGANTANGNGAHRLNGNGAAKNGAAKSMAESRTCSRCGNLTVRSGTCHTCTACGMTSGCS